jgi:hypothetical protein
MMTRMAESPQNGARNVQTVRGLLFSLIPLAVLALLVGALTGKCSFSPGGPNTEGAIVRTVDADAQVRILAARVPFPVRVPHPAGAWRPTSVDLERAGRAAGSPAVVQIGWLTPAGDYLQLSQSSAAEAELVPFEIGAPQAATGALQVQGRNWVVYPGRRGEQVWVADLGTERLLITGGAQEPEFRALAAATLAAPNMVR